MRNVRQSAKIILLQFLFIGLITPVSFAQNDFNLADYVNPDYQYQALDFGFQLRGNNSFRKDENDGNFLQKHYLNSLSSGINTSYYSIKNSKFYQGSQRGSVNFDSYFEKNRDVDEISYSGEASENSNNFSGDLYLSSTNRFYNQKKRFIGINFIFSAALDNSVRKYKDDNMPMPFIYKSNSSSRQLYASLPILVGTGRIEAVQDARLAVYILEDLEKSGDLKKTASNNEILAFAKFITQTKNQRFFDSRIRKIAEITAIDSMLNVLGLKGQSDASYYTLLNDNWENSNGPVRMAGHRFSFGIDPGFSTYYQNSAHFFNDTLASSGYANIMSYSKKQNQRTNSWNLGALVRYECEKPVNLYWQKSTFIQLGYSLNNDHTLNKYYATGELLNENETIFFKPDLQFQLSHTVGYFPNSRTSITLGAFTDIGQYWGDMKYNNGIEMGVNQFDLEAGLNLNCSYYFSPQLRFTINASGMYSYLKRTQEVTGSDDFVSSQNRLKSYFNASFTYSIF